MIFVTMRVFTQTRKIFSCRFVIAETLVQRAECVVIQRRRVRHDLEQTLAMFDHFGNLETVPATFFFAQDRFRGDIEVKNSLNFTTLRAPRTQPNDKYRTGEKYDDHRWESHCIEHRYNYNDCDRLRREFPCARHNPSTSISPVAR